MIAWVLLSAIGVCFLVSTVHGRECCKAHGNWFSDGGNDRFACSDYCCYDNTNYYCCNDREYRARPQDRMNCPHWIWIPIVVAICFILAIIGCVICCVKGCCGNGGAHIINTVTGGVYGGQVAAAAAPPINIVNNSNQTAAPAPIIVMASQQSAPSPIIMPINQQPVPAPMNMMPTQHAPYAPAPAPYAPAPAPSAPAAAAPPPYDSYNTGYNQK